MLRLKGSVGGVFRDAKTGEVTREFEFVDNHIQDWFLKKFYRATNSMPNLGDILFVSNYNPGRQRRDIVEDIEVGFSREGSDISGVTRREVFLDDSPGIHLIQTVQRFEPPAEDFEINSVGLCSYVSTVGDIVNSVTNFVWLENSCIQTTTESLDLFYRVQVLFETDYLLEPQTSRKLNVNEAKTVAYALANLSEAYLITKTTNNFFNGKFVSTDKLNSRHLLEINQSSFTPAFFTLSDADFQVDEEFFKSSSTGVSRLSNNIGLLVAHLSNNDANLTYKVLTEGESPIQSIFGHRNSSITPFYTASTAQLGLGTLSVKGDNWTNPDHPKYFKINITQTGNESVGEYNFKVADQYSFENNTFVSLGCCLHWSNEGNQKNYGSFSFTDREKRSNTSDTIRDTYPTFHSNNVVVFIKANEICKMDLLSGEAVIVNNETLVGTDLIPRFDAIDINCSITNDSKQTFIACRSKGVYRFNDAFDQLDIINNLTPGLENTIGCYGLDIGVSGRLWGFFSHVTQNSLYYSDDNGATWTASGFIDTDVDANIGNVLAVNCDKNNQHVALSIIGNNSKTLNDTNWRAKTKWWNQDTTTVSDGAESFYQASFVQLFGHKYAEGSPIGFQKCVVCSPSESIWATVNSDSTTSAKVQFYEFGTDNFTLLDNSETKNVFTNWFTDENGKDWLYGLTRYGATTGNSYSSFSTFMHPDGSFESFYSYDIYKSQYSEASSVFFVNDNGVMLLFSDSTSSPAFGLMGLAPHSKDEASYPLHNYFFYPTYGWNGTEWEKHNPNSKPIHSAEEELIDGVTIGFNDTGGTTPFLNTDHYTFGVFDGIWLDGFTTFEYFWEAYTKPTILNTETESANLPATTKVPNVLVATTHDNLAYFVDDESTKVTEPGNILATGTALDNDYNAGVRSLNRVIRTDISPFIPFAVFVPETDIKNAQGYVEVTVESSTSALSKRTQLYFGLSNSSRIGTTLDFNTIQYAIHVDNMTPEALAENDRHITTFRVVENGIERAKLENYDLGSYKAVLRIVLKNNASLEYMLKTPTGTWITLYESPVGSVPVEDLHLDISYVPTLNEGFKDISYHSLDSSSQDYYMYLGNGTDQGVYHPEFVSIDPETVKVKIDGVDAIMIGRDNSSTVLTTNTYSVYPYAGVIRFSAADAGKPVTAEYVTLVNE